MPAFLDRSDRRLVIGALVVMLLLLGLTYVLRPAPARPVGIPSSYSTDWLGTKGAFLLLQQSGYRVERWESPPGGASDRSRRNHADLCRALRAAFHGRACGGLAVRPRGWSSLGDGRKRRVVRAAIRAQCRFRPRI